MKLNRRLLINKLAGEEGFEPSLTGPEPAVLPLDYSPVYPENTPQKKTGIEQKIQSLLFNPPYLAQLVLKYQPKHQPISLSLSLYKLTAALFGPLHGLVRVLSRPIAAGGTGEPSPETVPLLPRYTVEVVM